MPELTLKDQGNDEFKKGNFLKAAGLYSKAIKEDPNNAVLYSNRCASLLKLNKVSKALEDAEHCIRLKPDWEKGYFRKGSALEAGQKYKEALAVYQQALDKNPDNVEVSAKIRNFLKFIRTLDKQSQSNGAAAGKAQSTSVPSLQPEIESFRKEWLQHATQQATQKDAEATVHFLPGKPTESFQEEETNVRAKNAFDNPDLLRQFSGFLASLQSKLDARAVCAVIPKQQVSFPEVWKKSGWPCGQEDGIFVQFMTPDYRQLLFIPRKLDKARTPVDLGTDFAILPWSLFQSQT